MTTLLLFDLLGHPVIVTINKRWILRKIRANFMLSSFAEAAHDSTRFFASREKIGRHDGH